MWVLGLAASLPTWLFQRAVVEEGAWACLLLLDPAQTSCYFTLLGAPAFLPCVLGLGGSFGHMGWLLWTQPRPRGGGRPGAPGEHQAHPRSAGGPRADVGALLRAGLLAAVGDLPATPVAYMASSLCTLLAYSSCALSPILCFSLSRPFRARLRDLFRRPLAARHPRAAGEAGVVMESVQPGRDGAPGSLWGLVGV